MFKCIEFLYLKFDERVFFCWMNQHWPFSVQTYRLLTFLSGCKLPMVHVMKCEPHSLTEVNTIVEDNSCKDQHERGWYSQDGDLQEETSCKEINLDIFNICRKKGECLNIGNPSNDFYKLIVIKYFWGILSFIVDHTILG